MSCSSTPSLLGPDAAALTCCTAGHYTGIQIWEVMSSKPPLTRSFLPHQQKGRPFPVPRPPAFDFTAHGLRHDVEGHEIEGGTKDSTSFGVCRVSPSCVAVARRKNLESNVVVWKVVSNEGVDEEIRPLALLDRSSGRSSHFFRVCPIYDSSDDPCASFIVGADGGGWTTGYDVRELIPRLEGPQSPGTVPMHLKPSFDFEGETGWNCVVKHLPRRANLLAAGGGSNKVVLWSLEKEKLWKVLPGHSSTIYDICAHAEMNCMFSVACDRNLCVWSSQDDSLVAKVEHNAMVLSCKVAYPEGWYLVVGETGGYLYVHDIRKLGEPTYVGSYAMHPHGYDNVYDCFQLPPVGPRPSDATFCSVSQKGTISRFRILDGKCLFAGRSTGPRSHGYTGGCYLGAYHSLWHPDGSRLLEKDVGEAERLQFLSSDVVPRTATIQISAMSIRTPRCMV